MYWRTNNGGWNKSHETVEKTPRIDSYEAGEVEYRGHLFGYADKGFPLVLDCYRYTDYGLNPETDREVVEVWHPTDWWSQILELSRKRNGFGGNQAFFLCPACGDRRRYLYLTGSTFLCRKCAKLNYQSQQETRSGSMYYYHKGIALVDRRLYTWSSFRPDGFSFCDWIPARPRYMHGSTYRRHLLRFLRYRKKHEDRQLAELRALLGPKAWAEIERLQHED